MPLTILPTPFSNINLFLFYIDLYRFGRKSGKSTESSSDAGSTAGSDYTGTKTLSINQLSSSSLLIATKSFIYTGHNKMPLIELVINVNQGLCF